MQILLTGNKIETMLHLTMGLSTEREDGNCAVNDFFIEVPPQGDRGTRPPKQKVWMKTSCLLSRPNRDDSAVNVIIPSLNRSLIHAYFSQDQSSFILPLMKILIKKKVYIFLYLLLHSSTFLASR